MSAPLNTILPRRGGLKPTIELTSVVLPTPLRPSRPRIWPCSSLQRQSLQDVGVAVVGVDVLDFQDRHGSTGPQIDFLHFLAARGFARSARFPGPRRNAAPRCGRRRRTPRPCRARSAGSRDWDRAASGISPSRRTRPRTGRRPARRAAGSSDRWRGQARSRAGAARRARGSAPRRPCGRGSRRCSSRPCALS